jgi:hypothetical protein
MNGKEGGEAEKTGGRKERLASDPRNGNSIASTKGPSWESL